MGVLGARACRCIVCPCFWAPRDTTCTGLSVPPHAWGHFFVRRTNEGSPARRADVSESVIGAEWCHCGLVVEGKMLIALKIENALRTLVAELSARPGRP